MERKIKLTKGIALALKIISIFAMYFCICILITAADKIVAANKFGMGYAVLMIGGAFLVVQFCLSMRVIKEMFSSKANNWISSLIKVLAGASLYFSLALLVNYAEDIISPETATIGFLVAFLGVLMASAQFLLMAYGVGCLIESKSQPMANKPD